MTTDTPQISESDIDACREGLPVDLPVPERVDVVADEDFEGDPVYRMTVVFPPDVAVEETAWKRIHPLLTKLSALVSERSGYERPILTEIRRLAEAVAK